MKPIIVAGRIAIASIALAAASAFAQTAASADAASIPLQLQVPAQAVVPQSTPETDSDNAIVDAQDEAADRGDDGTAHGPQVHGSFTAGVGYSKGYGTSRYGAADLDISGESDSGRSYDVHLHLMQGTGPGFAPYGGYYAPRGRD